MRKATNLDVSDNAHDHVSRCDAVEPDIVTPMDRIDRFQLVVWEQRGITAFNLELHDTPMCSGFAD
jgi:hypothetical protein